MPTFWGAYDYEGWDTPTFSTGLTYGSTGTFNTTGVNFKPTGETGVPGDITWMDSFSATSLTVVVSCHTPNTANTGGFVGLVDENLTSIVGQSVDLSDGGQHTIVLDTTGVDWTTVRGLAVRSGDAAVAHTFTLHSSSYTGGSAETIVGATCAIAGGATASFTSGLVRAGEMGIVSGGTAAFFTGVLTGVGFHAEGGAVADLDGAMISCAKTVVAGNTKGKLLLLKITTTRFSATGASSPTVGGNQHRSSNFTIGGAGATAFAGAAVRPAQMSAAGGTTLSQAGGHAIAGKLGILAGATMSFSGGFDTFDFSAYQDQLIAGSITIVTMRKSTHVR